MKTKEKIKGAKVKYISRQVTDHKKFTYDKRKRKFTMKNHKILPFYMTYPVSFGMEDNREMLKDLEYMQQMYPDGAKLLQNEINKSINIYDYRGSMIYDEYPDRFMLYKMGREILDNLLRNKEQHKDNAQYMMMLEWDGIEDFIMVLLFYEILRRRHKGWDYMKGLEVQPL